MPVSMYSVSIPVFMQHLNGLSGVLDKAAAWAAARKVNEADLLKLLTHPWSPCPRVPGSLKETTV